MSQLKRVYAHIDRADECRKRRDMDGLKPNLKQAKALLSDHMDTNDGGNDGH